MWVHGRICGCGAWLLECVCVCVCVCVRACVRACVRVPVCVLCDVRVHVCGGPARAALLQHALELQQKYGLSGNSEVPTVALFGPDGEAVTSEEQLSSKGVQTCLCVCCVRVRVSALMCRGGYVRARTCVFVRVCVRTCVWAGVRIFICTPRLHARSFVHSSIRLLQVSCNAST